MTSRSAIATIVDMDPSHHPVEQGLHEFAERLVRRQGIRHCVVGVERQCDGQRWVASAGTSDTRGTPMSNVTPFHFTSVTKLFTTAVVAQLHEERHIDLDTPVAEYVPGNLIEGLHRLDGVDHTGRITVRHLLSHTSGLPDYFLARPDGADSYADTITRHDIEFTVSDVADRVRRLTPRFAPQASNAKRQRAAYSDTNFHLLGAVVEAVTTQRFHDVVADRVLTPLSLDSTWFAGHPRRINPTNAAATLWAGDSPLDRPAALRSMGPDGGLIGTADDALTFLRAFMSGRLFSEHGTLENLQRRWNRFGLPRDRTSIAAPMWPIQYAAGIKRFTVGRLLVPGFVRTVAIGHTGASGSFAFHVPAHDLYLAGTVDQTQAAAVPYRSIPRLLRIAAT